MFKSAAQEITQWADQCRRWARRARNNEQRLTLQNWERLFNEAAVAEQQHELEAGYGRTPHAPSKS